MDDGPAEGFGRRVLKALAVASALAFLAIVMVNACATYAGSKPSPVVTGQPAAESAPAADSPMLAAPTKAGPVVPPRPLLKPAATTPSGQSRSPEPGASPQQGAP